MFRGTEVTICQFCGHRVPLATGFCPICGHNLTKITTSEVTVDSELPVELPDAA